MQGAEYSDRVDDALRAYKSGDYKSYRAAARVFDMLRTTLTECANRRNLRNLSHEDQQILSAEKEKKLVRWITHLTICGYPPKPYMTREIAEAIQTQWTLKINNPSATYIKYDQIGEQWVPRFLAHHPELASVMPE